MTTKGMLIRGRFARPLDSVMAEINQSIRFDHVMYEQDILQSSVHAEMLGRIGLITADATEQIVRGLSEIRKEIGDGTLELSIELEDIHMNVESALKEKIGDTAGFLPSARSRNDQVATDLKMWIRATQPLLQARLARLIRALARVAAANVETVAPGYTHLQPGQPVSFAHHLLCYVEMFFRDLKRYRAFLELSEECPLGSAALAGTSLNIDREYTATRLGFARPGRNSIDGVSDRDFALDHLYANTTVIQHLSRLSEEIVLWMNPQFGFIALSDEWTTGSSIMPQKRNPDAAEIIRGKVGRVVGSLNALLITLKGLPLTFSKDMQEDKEPVFDSTKNLSICLDAMCGMVENMSVNIGRLGEAAGRGFSTATDVADYLAFKKGYPFRKAHEMSGKLVRLAEEQGTTLDRVDPSAAAAICPDITAELLAELQPQKSLRKRTSYGGTAPDQVRHQLHEIEARLAGLGFAS